MVALAPGEVPSCDVTDCRVFVWGDMDFGGRGVPEMNDHAVYTAQRIWALRHTTLRKITAGGARQVNSSVPAIPNKTRREIRVVRRIYGT